MAKKINHTVTPSNVGETWYVRLPGRHDLVTAKVEAVTVDTVLLTYSTKGLRDKLRYHRDDVDFVEKVS